MDYDLGNPTKEQNIIIQSAVESHLMTCWNEINYCLWCGVDCYHGNMMYHWDPERYPVFCDMGWRVEE